MSESRCTYLKATVKLVKGWFACMAVLCFTVALPGLSLSSGDFDILRKSIEITHFLGLFRRITKRVHAHLGRLGITDPCPPGGAVQPTGKPPLYMMLKTGRDNKEREEGQETRQTSWCQWQWLSMRKQDGQGRTNLTLATSLSFIIQVNPSLVKILWKGAFFFFKWTWFHMISTFWYSLISFCFEIASTIWTNFHPFSEPCPFQYRRPNRPPSIQLHVLPGMAFPQWGKENEGVPMAYSLASRPSGSRPCNAKQLYPFY